MGKLKNPTTDPDAIRANIAHNFVTQRGFEMIKAMIACGDILYHAKAKVGHGKWLRWCRLNLEFQHDTVSRYIKLYEHRDEIIMLEPGSLREALAIISDTKRITPGLISGDYKILRRALVSPIKVVTKNLDRLPTDPMHYETVNKVLEELVEALIELNARMH